MIYDNRSAAMILGCLLKNPRLLVETNSYQLTTEDFVGRLHRIIFSVIYNLYHNGVEIINLEEFHGYLQNYPELYTVFEKESGTDVILTAVEIAELENFDFHYSKLKKMSVLRDLNSQGFDTTKWYEPDSYDISKRQEMEKNLENTSVQEIIQSYIGAVSEIESRYVNRENFRFGKIIEGVEELVEKLKVQPEVGLPFQNKIFTSISRGARKAKLYMVSAATGISKTRLAVANACHSAYPIRYDSRSKQWVQQGNSSRTLFVTTEQDFEEIQTMVLAYLSEVNEEKILNGTFNAEEEIRISIAVSIMKYYANNFYISHLPDPNIAQINSNIRRLSIVNKIENIYYDYIHTSPQLLAEFQGLRIREDVALLLVATALKNLANELEVFIWTSTQVNAQEEDIGFADQRVLRGSRALSDKVDIAVIMRKVTPDMLKPIEPLLKGSLPTPNLYFDIYKNRRSKHNRVRLWIYADLGTMRFQDLFLTNEYGEQILFDLITPKQKKKIPSLEEIVRETKEKNSQPFSAFSTKRQIVKANSQYTL